LKPMILTVDFSLTLTLTLALTLALTFTLTLKSARGDVPAQTPLKQSAWRTSLTYLSPRLSAGEGRYYSAHVTAGEAQRALWLSGEWALSLNAHTLAWRGTLNNTPTSEDFTPTSTSSSDGALGSFTPLTPPTELSEALRWRFGGGGGLLLSRHSASGGLSPFLTLGAGLSALSSREALDPLSMSPLRSPLLSPLLSPWVSGVLRWRGAVQSFLGLWLSGRWGGLGVGRVSTGSPLLSPLSRWSVNAGLSLGRAELGGGLEHLGGRIGLSGGVSLPLSAPLYLVGSVWLDLEGGAEGRMFSVAMRWTGERIAPELAPPKANESSRGTPQQRTRGPSLPQAPVVSPISPR
jgi:hypothetical protein